MLQTKFKYFHYHFVQSIKSYLPVDAVDDDLQKIGGHLQGGE